MTDETKTTETVEKKGSIVPGKYAGKYKGGGSDELAKFINEQSTDASNGFSFAKFFELCRTNGVAEEKVKHYEGQVEAKIRGAEGRARMTLRNMLATFVRKNGQLDGLDGTEHAITIAPLPARSQKAEPKAA